MVSSWGLHKLSQRAGEFLNQANKKRLRELCVAVCGAALFWKEIVKADIFRWFLIVPYCETCSLQ